MNRSLRVTLPWRLAAFTALMLTSAWAQAQEFAINAGVTYRVSNDEIRSRYAAIAADLSKLLDRKSVV